MPEDRVSVDDARRDGPPRFEGLSAVERDVLVAIAGVGDRGDPRIGAHFDELAGAMERWYDDRRIATASVEEVCLDLTERELAECVGTGAFRVTPDGRGLVEAYLGNVGRLWDDTVPWTDGSKLVIETRQVGDDVTDRVGQEVTRD